MSRHPEVVWAQRSENLFITVHLPDAKDVQTNLDPEGKLSYSAKAGPEDQEYAVELELFDKIDVENSKAVNTSRQTLFMIQKSESKWWPRLIKASGRAPAFLKVDWDKWVDEDEETSAGQFDPEFMKQFQGGGFGGLGGGLGGGFGGGDFGGGDFGGADFGAGDLGGDEDEEEEELGDLEK
eukprot:TRINITY_DN2280_c0_g1_i1.p1 TRINITY_DN2280_c0_g1~~TRINITY_DN2280_c0_g1_i1.p1  ORF type:complete len:181 (-),score=32.74 TRINITY_DN2280_c0_g1_i1:93-635(-)